MNEQLKDRLLTCVDCGKEFLFSVPEQRFFSSKQLSVPKRCKDCRAERKKTITPNPDSWRE